MKKIFVLPLIFFFGLVLASCNSLNNNNPVSSNTDNTGSIYVSSQPKGAEIWLDGKDTGQTTDDSVTSVQAGTHSITLKLSGYRDTTVTDVTVKKGLQSFIFLPLNSTVSLSEFGTIKIYETTGTTAQQPSGIDLSNGDAYGISGSNKDSVDIYYSSDGFKIRSANYSSNMTRSTGFYIGNGTDLNDGVSSPQYNTSWVTNIPDTENNYVFLYDADGHYSKLIITNWHGGTGPGDPSWVEVKWIYNNNANDTRF